MKEKDIKDFGPIEINREEFIERLTPGIARGGELKRKIRRDFDVDGSIISQTLVERPKLTCGCLNKEAAVNCVCGNSVWCDMHGQQMTIPCSECGRAMSPCCIVESSSNPGVFYCTQCKTSHFVTIVLETIGLILVALVTFMFVSQIMP